MIYFSSDHHYFHKNILKYQPNRKYSSLDEMNRDYIKKWNQTVKPNDDIYYIGDFAFASKPDALSIYKQLNGRKYLVSGNHDSDGTLTLPWQFVKQYYELKYQKQTFVLCHYPFESWNKSFHGSYHLHGHSHGHMPSENRLRLDVGVDCHDGFPIAITQVCDILQLRTEAWKRNQSTFNKQL